MSIRAQGILAFSLLALLVVAMATAFHLSAIAEFALDSMVDDARQLAGQAQVQVRRAIAAAPETPPQTVIREDEGIAALLESSVGFFDYVKYVAVVDPEGRVLAHSTPFMVGELLPRKPDVAGLQRETAFAKLSALQRDQDFEVVLPLRQAESDFGAVRVGVATSFVRSGLTEAIRRSLVLAGVALLLAVLMAAALANVIALQLQKVSAGIERVGRGEFGHSLEVLPSEDLGHLFTSFNEMSQRLAQDQSLIRDKNEELGALVDAFEDGVVMVNRDGRILLVNPSAGRVLGREVSDLVGESIQHTLGPNHALTEMWREAVEDTDARERADVRLDSDASGSRYFVSAYPVADGRRNGVMLTLRNTDSLRQLASLFDESHRMIAWGQVALGVAHEIKNPLHAMSLHLNLARDKMERRGGNGDVHGVTEHLDTVGAQIRRMDDVVNGFLRFARMNRAAAEPLDLNAILAEVTGLVSSETEAGGIEVRFAPGENMPELWGDRDLLLQAFLNLVQNATQAGPHRGPIEVSLDPKDHRRGVIVEVRDHGRGLSAEAQAQMFDLFYTTREDGSGIGLAIVKRVIELHHGQIQVVSQPGQGTLFRVWLPPNIPLNRQVSPAPESPARTLEASR